MDWILILIVIAIVADFWGTYKVNAYQHQITKAKSRIDSDHQNAQQTELDRIHLPVWESKLERFRLLRVASRLTGLVVGVIGITVFVWGWVVYLTQAH